jgi:hypothetical protein
LEFLRELIGDGLQRNDTLFRAASAGVVDLLENSIRVGFYLSDAKSYLAGDGKFIKWVDQNLRSPMRGRTSCIGCPNIFLAIWSIHNKEPN